MPSAEEDILLLLLPQMQERLDFIALKPHLKLSCSLTEEECQLLFEHGQNMQGNNIAHVLVDLLREKAPHCCARMFLGALKQHQKNSHNAVSDYSEIIELLHTKLQGIINGEPSHATSGCPTEGESISTSLNFFPSAVPESPTNQSSRPPMYLEPSKSTQNPGNEMALVITIGPSKEPAPLMRYEFHSLASKSMTNEQTNHELIMRSKSIQSKFSDLIFGICSLLQSSYAADIEKLRMWLSYQSCSQSAQSLQAFDSDSDALKAKSIPALILSLKCYTSWYNYGLIADIAKKFCGDKGSALVEAYEDELQLYLKTLIIHCPPLFPDHDNSTKALSCFEVDVEWNPSTSFLEDIAIFKSTLCKLCNLDPRFLVITTINATDFRMSWAIPKAAAGIINEVKTQSQHEGVKFIKLPGDLKTPGQASDESVPAVSVPEKNNVSRSSLATDSHNSSRGTLSSGNGDEKSTTEYKRSDHKVTLHKAMSIASESTAAREFKKIHHGNRAKRALSIGAALPDAMTNSGLLSEISETLKSSGLFSHDTIETLPLTAPSQHSVSHQKEESPGDPVLLVQRNDRLSNTAAAATVPAKKSVSFLWRVLGRAKPTCHANIHVVSIQTIHKLSDGDIEVRKGQHLKALYRVSERVFVETPSLIQGFVPYSSCRLSRKHYGSHSNLIQLSYVRLYPESPDGIDVLPNENIPSIKMVALVDHFSESAQDELQVHSKQVFTALYCDSTWVYATYGNSGGLLPRTICDLSSESQKIFEQWKVHEQLFQSDYVIKHAEDHPTILDKKPVCIPTSSQKAASKVGKFFTIVQNFVPTSPTSGNFTIRKGLRVKVVDESNQQVCVTTKTGVSFWIPQNHVRPARKSSAVDKFMHS